MELPIFAIQIASMRLTNCPFAICALIVARAGRGCALRQWPFWLFCQESGIAICSYRSVRAFIIFMGDVPPLHPCRRQRKTLNPGNGLKERQNVTLAVAELSYPPAHRQTG